MLRLAIGVFILAMTGCAGQGYSNAHSAHVNLAAHPAWYNGERVYYVTTDVSDRAMAESMQANYAPRLRDAIPDYPKPPQVRTVLERVYRVRNFDQPSIFPSAPEPLSSNHVNLQYSPLWLMYEVVWKAGATPVELKSEEQIFVAESQGKLEILRTDIVVNCPVVRYEGERIDRYQW
ncbi:hypothetical protein HCH_03037 [Hahella chejuensis KCTC 2396]|uniref:DUF7482 domain-containing protein n=1 Tax=Hahella chejuensis (strain KCTC 2396) TaxID=349521 RepID=Q2SHS1_HAHCH|nr:hypothetical protein [Hahella chejuensis]ABC29803.1 hypothetical protein HCH_03037 [Hahella chejuensis KCTC 2396]